MSSKRKQEHGYDSDSEDTDSYPPVEGSKLHDSRRLKSNQTPATNGLPDDVVRVARHVHWQSDSDDENRSNSTDAKRHSTGIEPDRVRGGNEGEGSGGAVGPLSSGHRLISVKPYNAASSDDEEEEEHDEGEDDDEDGKDDAKRQTSIATSIKVSSGETSKNTREVSQVLGTPQSNIIHSDLPVIDLESDACTASGLEVHLCLNGRPFEDSRTSGPDPIKPKSFLDDSNDTIDVTKPVTAFDNPSNTLEVRLISSVPVVTVSYLRHDPMAAAGDAARGSSIPEITEVPSHSNENEADVKEGLDGGATAIHGKATDAPAAAASATAADLEAPERGPLPSASSSSSQSLDRSASMLHDFSSDLSLQRDPVEPDERTPFARVEPEAEFLEERGECDGEETPAPVYILPGSNLRYTDDMILTTRPSKVNLLYSPAPPRTRILFQIIRDKIGFYRKYYAHLELNGEKIFYLAGRKRVKSRSSSYVISIDRERLLRACDAYVGKLRSNYMGTKFTLYYTGEAPPSSDEQQRTGARSKTRQKEELASIIYAPNPLGFYGPRRMTVILPAVTDTDERIPNTSQNAQDDTLLGRYKARQFKDLLILHNKPPVWERAKNSYVLNFHGRVTQPSVKNFQLVPPDDHNDIVMQFGRTGANTFTMDYRRPLSAVQAFGIVLSCFDCKLACE